MSAALRAANAASNPQANAGGAGTPDQNEPNANPPEGEGEPTEEDPAPAAPTETPNARLLRESQANKARAVKAEQALAAIHRKQQEDQGQYKELADEYKAKFEGVQKKLMTTAIAKAISDSAAKAGCVNPKALMKLGDMSQLTYDEETGEVTGAEAFVEAAKSEHGYLFQGTRAPVVNPARPGGVPLVTKTKKSAAELAKLPKGHPERQAAYAAAMDRARKEKR